MTPAHVTRLSDLATQRAERQMWAAAILLWVVGDLATTAAGLQLGAVEQSATGAATIANAGVVGLVPHKVAALGLFAGVFAATRPLSRLSALGVPLGLSVLGAVATGVNSAVIVAVVQ